MATDVQINATVNAIVAAFGGDAELFSAFLVRSKLETEKLELQSEERALQAEFGIEQTAYNEAIAANVDAQNAKQAEIDALG